MVVCGMGNVGPWVFEEILRGIPDAADEWQMVLTNNGRYDVVELRVELGDQSSQIGDRIPGVRAAVLANIKERFPDADV